MYISRTTDAPLVLVLMWFRYQVAQRGQLALVGV